MASHSEVNRRAGAREVWERGGVQVGVQELGFWIVSTACEVKPVVGPPFHFLNGGFAAQVASLAPGKGTTAKMGHIPFAALCFHKAGVSGFLKGEFGFSGRGQNRVLRMQFVGTEKVMGSGQTDGVFVFSSALCSQQVVEAVALVQVGSFGEPDGTSLEDQLGLAGQLLGLGSYS